MTLFAFLYHHNMDTHFLLSPIAHPIVPHKQVKGASLTTGESILRHPSSSGSDGDHVDNQTKKKSASSTKSSRSVTFSLGANSLAPASPSASDASLSIKGHAPNGLSARAKRSKRRQAKIEKDPTKISSAIKKEIGKRSIEASISKKHGKGKSSKSGASTTKKGDAGKEEEVVKVKLNTGTLYLYKGLHRRAVFVRRV